MADIDIQKKGPSIWPWIIGLALLLLLGWLVAEWLGDDDEVEVAGEQVGVVTEPVAVPPAAVVAPGTEPAGAPGAGAEPLPVGLIVTSPANYAGQPMAGLVRVTEVPTDRGFWIEDQGQRLFVVLDEPKPEIKNVNAGQQVRIQDARVYDAQNLSQIPGNLDADTRRIIQGLPAVLYVTAKNLEIVQPAA